MHYRFLAFGGIAPALRGGAMCVLAVAQLALAERVSADNVDRRVDRAGEAAVAAELDGDRSRPKERARKQPGPADPAAREQARPRRGKPISLGLLLGYGIELDDLGVNPWGVGFGARIGYNAGPLFLGGRFVFYLGEDPSNIWELGLEGGYDVKSGVVTVRPGLGFGLANLVIDAPGEDSTTDAYLAPGMSLLFDASRDVFFGVDGRAQFILAEPDGFEAIIVLGNLGMRF